MPHLEIRTQVAQRLHDLSEQTQTTVDEILSRLLDSYGAMLVSVSDDMAGDDATDNNGANNDVTWTDEELAELLKPQKPLTGKEIVEQGYIGGWEDMGIEDSVEWLAQQKAKRRKKYQW